MESPTRISNIQEPHPYQLNCSSGRKSKDSICTSPEFEFWMVRNPSFPQTNLHSADELFVDGILRPLHHLHVQHNPHENPQPLSETDPQPPASITPQPSNSTTVTSSKRWKDIFKKSTTNRQDRDKEKAKEKKKEKKGVSTSTLNTAESLSIINIWPFSRSRSAGNNGNRGRLLSGTRKVSSAPCSRSNSGGESKTRKWPSSPSRSGGVHLGRSSPVWQLRRTCEHNKSDPSRRSRTSSIPTMSADGNKARVLNFNVPNMCIGYGHHLSCRSDENTSNGGGGKTGRYRDTATNVAAGNNPFNLRTLFSTTRKVH